jgi:hypothetical protein
MKLDNQVIGNYVCKCNYSALYILFYTYITYYFTHVLALSFYLLYCLVAGAFLFVDINTVYSAQHSTGCCCYSSGRHMRIIMQYVHDGSFNIIITYKPCSILARMHAQQNKVFLTSINYAIELSYFGPCVDHLTTLLVGHKSVFRMYAHTITLNLKKTRINRYALPFGNFRFAVSGCPPISNHYVMQIGNHCTLCRSAIITS